MKFALSLNIKTVDNPIPNHQRDELEKAKKDIEVIKIKLGG